MTNGDEAANGNGDMPANGDKPASPKKPTSRQRKGAASELVCDAPPAHGHELAEDRAEHRRPLLARAGERLHRASAPGVRR